MIVDNGATPLHHAAYEGQIDIVKHLVKFLDNRNLSKKVKQKYIVNFLENLWSMKTSVKIQNTE